MGDTLVSWSSRKQGTLAQSSTEAEYRAIVTTDIELEAFNSLPTELGLTLHLPLNFFSDNQGATFVVNIPVCRTKLRHVTMDLHFLEQRLKKGDYR